MAGVLTQGLDNHVTTTTYDARAATWNGQNALDQVVLHQLRCRREAASMTDPNKLVIAFTYDRLGQVLQKSAAHDEICLRPSRNGEPRYPAGRLHHRYTYDAAHRSRRLPTKQAIRDRLQLRCHQQPGGGQCL